MKRRKSDEPVLSTIKDYGALDSVWSALEARPAVLASRLRDGKASRVEIRLAADLIEGKVKPRRPRRGFSRSRRLELAEHVAFLEKVLPHVQQNVLRKQIISLAAEDKGVKERHVYDALAEFDGDALAQSERMYQNSFGEVEVDPPELDPEKSKRVRDILKGASPDFLLEIIEGFLARK
jgi:hypothetical protein